MFGVDHNDPIEDASGKTKTNHAGGVVGGYTNGNDLVFRIAVKPTSSTPKDQTTWNWETNEQEVFSVKGRHDLCIKSPRCLGSGNGYCACRFNVIRTKNTKNSEIKK